MKEKSKRKILNYDTAAIIIIFGVNLLLRFIYYLVFFDKHNLNVYLPQRLDEITVLFINGATHSFPTAWSSYHLILSLIYLPLKYLNLLDQRLAVTAIFNLFLCSLTAVIIYRISLKIFPKEKYLSYIITGIFTLYYPLYYFSLLSIPESLFTLILTGLFYILIAYPFNIRASLLVGMLLAVGLIIKPVILSLILCLLPWIVVVKILNEKSSFKYLLNTLIVFLILYFAAAGLNFKFDKNHTFAVIGNGGVNFTMAWCEPKRISYSLENGENRWFAPPVFGQKANLSELNYNVPFRNQKFYYLEGLECLKQKPVRLITNIGHLVNIFQSKLYPNLIDKPIHNKLVDLWKIITIPLLVGFLVFPVFNKKRRKEWLLGLIFIFSLIGAVYFSNPGEERYLVPYYFTLIIFGCWLYKMLLLVLLGRLHFAGDTSLSK
jgi:hypothetical protein